MKTVKQFALVLVLLLLPVLLFMYAEEAHASDTYLADFIQAYPNSATSNAGCQVCHLVASPGSTARNVYGAAWAANGHNFANVESLNSDGVGGTNLQEIQAGAQPGWCVQTAPGCVQLTGTPPNVPLDNTTTANQPPVLNPIGAKSVNENQTLTFTATATDPNGNALTFSAGGLPTGATFSPAGAFNWTPTFSQAGNYNVTITVTDNGTPAASDFEVVTITVNNVNRPPVLNTIGNQTGTEGQLLTFTATATDPDGNALTFAGSNLPTGATVSAAGAFSWTPTFSQAGNYPNVMITVTDNGTPAQTASQAFTITVGNVNRPPVLAPIGAKSVNAGQSLTFTATATDPDGDALTFSGGNLPTGATLTPAGAFSWTPAAGQTGPFSVTITVTDNGSPPQNDFETFTITVGTTANRPPVLNPIGAKSVNEGQLLTFTATATDPDGGTLTFSATGLPSGATLSQAGVFSWTPSFSQSGNYPVTVTVSDGALSASENITITVGNVNRPPVLSPSPIGNRTVTAGQTLTIAITATDPDGGTLTFTGTNLPTGATLTPSGSGAATFSWTPATNQAGSFPDVTLTVSDGALTDAEVFTITVNPATTVNRPPVLTNPGNKTVNAGQLLSFTLAATDPDGNGLTFSAGNSPAGATLTQGGAFSWTPTAAQVSTTPYSVTVTVTDNGSPALSASQTFTITVNAPLPPPPANQAPTVTNPGNKTVTVGSLLSFTITGTDPNAGQTRTFSAGTTLPAGATLSPSGAFAWIPTAAQVSATPYSVTVTATDNGSPPMTSAPVTFTITVQAPGSTGLDYSIVSFTATNGIRLRSGTPVTFRLAVKNVGTLSGPVPATLVGLQNGVEVYRRTMQVSAPVGTTTTLGFQPYTPTRGGTIQWTVTVQDQGPAYNTATATTTIIVQPRRGRDEEHSSSED